MGRARPQPGFVLHGEDLSPDREQRGFCAAGEHEELVRFDAPTTSMYKYM
jgi:hypothetical protein